MKKLFVIACFMLSSSAFAGPSISGGGKGVICRDQAGKVLSAELLDIWEAKEIYGRAIEISNLPVAKQVELAFDRLKLGIFPYADQDGTNALAFLNSRADSFLREKDEFPVRRLRNVTLTPTEDSFETAKPSNCEIEQIVNYKQSLSQQEIFVNQDLYEKLDATNQAALIVHESIYSLLRDYSAETNSLRTRRAVGYIFAGQSFGRLSDLIPAKHIACGTDLKAPDMYFFQGKDKNTLRSVTVRFGAERVGYFVAESPVHPWLQLEDWTKIFTDQVCEGIPENGEGTTHNGYALIMGSAGPVDYDNNNMLLFFCRQGKLEVRLSPDGNYEAKRTDTKPVACELRQ